MADESIPRSGTQAIERAVAVLRALEHDAELGVSEMAQRVGLSVSTTHRIVRALCDAGLLDQEPRSERYLLGPRLAQLGQLAWDRLGFTVARPQLEELARETGEAVNLGVRRGITVVVMLSAGSPQPLRFEQPPGSQVPLHASAMGKVLLAFTADPVAAVAALPGLAPYTQHTITNRRRLLAELRRVRKSGFAVNDEERNVGVIAIGAPLLDRSGLAVAAISLQGPTVRIGAERIAELAPLVISAASRLAAVLPLDLL